MSSIPTGNRQIDKEYHICKVTQVLKNKGYGFARCGRDIVMFHIKQGKPIMAGRSCPEFRPGKTALPSVGDEIVAFVEENEKQQWQATHWGDHESFKAAELLISDRKAFHRAPVLPFPAKSAVAELGRAIEEGKRQAQ